TIYHLREGIERFLITDINNPAATARAQSDIPVMFDCIASASAPGLALAGVPKFNHVPGGSNLLYMDGHVKFVRYDENGVFPVNGEAADLLSNFLAGRY
ncbi:MAG: hypothetical protein GWP08_20910, partial [Nitrospiraceae bacterium]|nr:hypothetical protein [Nitrospiraceae bacterium]